MSPAVAGMHAGYSTASQNVAAPAGPGGPALLASEDAPLRVLVLGDSSTGKTTLVHRVCHYHRFPGPIRSDAPPGQFHGGDLLRPLSPSAGEALQRPFPTHRPATVGCHVDVCLLPAGILGPSGGGGGGAGGAGGGAGGGGKMGVVEFMDIGAGGSFSPADRAVFILDTSIDALILVHDVSNPHTFSNLWNWVNELAETLESSSRQHFGQPPSASAGLGRSFLRMPVLVVGTKVDQRPFLSGDPDIEPPSWVSQSSPQGPRSPGSPTSGGLFSGANSQRLASSLDHHARAVGLAWKHLVEAAGRLYDAASPGAVGPRSFPPAGPPGARVAFHPGPEAPAHLNLPPGGARRAVLLRHRLSELGGASGTLLAAAARLVSAFLLALVWGLARRVWLPPARHAAEHLGHIFPDLAFIQLNLLDDGSYLEASPAIEHFLQRAAGQRRSRHSGPVLGPSAPGSAWTHTPPDPSSSQPSDLASPPPSASFGGDFPPVAPSPGFAHYPALFHPGQPASQQPPAYQRGASAASFSVYTSAAGPGSQQESPRTSGTATPVTFGLYHGHSSTGYSSPVAAHGGLLHPQQHQHQHPSYPPHGRL
ncbi:hypothetical protein H696_01180 [Fonticula alba]|uniref:Uncharacterized protein n=1 Tax=Fonticula alba TaxID=691883 RepID=A0A058ZE75_FONAL|nr:hypothetical protein H696_01180 [Fonticula alba]KCV71762.1 hypothetical protein H696_01180 [Fonticula alba]|eukprot:XP_009493340.1 hypothetical protein H696_01180 [Fonticula alba]